MSKLGLNKSKPPSTSAMGVIAEEPPDKRRKMDIDEIFDDDFDIILTQNMNQLDSLVASSCLRSISDAQDNCASAAAASSIVIKSSSASCLGSSALVQSSVVQNSNVRLVGRGSSHSRSMDYSTGSTSHAANAFSNPSVGKVPCADKSKVDPCTTTTFCVQQTSKPTDAVSNPLQRVVSFAKPQSAGDRSIFFLGSDSSQSLSVPKLSTGCNGYTAPAVADLSCITEERDYYKAQLSELQNEQYSKDGQIKILRDKFNRSQAELSLQKQEALKSMERRTEEKSRREQELQQESERLQADLQFKEHELAGLREYLKKLERKLVVLDVPSMQSAVVAEVPRSPSSSRFLGQFDSLTTTTKSSKTASPQKVSVTNVLPALTPVNESRVEGSCSRGQSIECKRLLKMKLAVPNSKGRLMGPTIVSKLLNKPVMLNDPLSALSMKSLARSPKSPNRDTSKQSSPTGCSKSLAPMVQPTSESSRLASAGFHLLLASESLRSDTAGPCSGLLASDNACAVLLLPQIEDALRVLQPQPIRRTTPTSTSSQSTACSTLANNNDCAESVKSAASLMSCLCRLHVLVCSCRHVRIAMIGDGEKTVKCTNTPADEHKASADLDPKSSVSSMDSTSPAGINVMSGRFNPCIERVMHNCQLMELLIIFANPVQDKPWLSSVACICLDILVELVCSCSKEHLNRFKPLLQSELIVKCLTDITVEDCESSGEHFRIVCSAMKILGALVQSRQLFSTLCSIAQECPLSTMFNFCTIGFPETWSCTQVASCCEAMITTLSCMISMNADGASCLLLRPDCQCGTKIIKDLIHVLRTLFDSYSSSSNCSKSFLVLRKCLAVLHSLAVAADVSGGQSFTSRCSVANTDYLTSMFGVVNMFQHLPIRLPDIELNNIWNVLPPCLSRFVVEEDPDERFEKDTANTNCNSSS